MADRPTAVHFDLVRSDLVLMDLGKETMNHDSKFPTPSELMKAVEEPARECRNPGYLQALRFQMSQNGSWGLVNPASTLSLVEVVLEK